ncbi:phosphatase [Megasphaera cerevisiae DSM 20462]|jgi:KDO2-lipid IV(A) lauroyltransferase|uniref:Phosphatase n=1 Tax=Megasphaera cerevisiae DSM 20462 TaxID=1122219 RepID=A0A0J6WXY0_9FIRM|nr:lysophospholipid acyltransferase family protein [Megasphaera cerevisiae]KMO86707.1 phosphatase [Megasphaera cerevisiae DSM 20462]OKY53304.1 phosphatase [Megasphaera cerevisiae]SJZ86131.1 KDO2-lipid IV(A) lauroyltransferase [Megasphaera cerevisiae DSM 20462]
MYTFLKCLSFIICHISEGMRHRAGNFLGWIFWIFVPRKRKILAQNQILSCGITADPKQAMAIAKASSVRFGPMIVEVLSFPLYTRESLNEKVTLRGKEYLDELKQSGEGAIVQTAHIGNWELIGAALPMNGYPLVSVAQEQNSKSADTFINEYRAMMKEHVTYKTGIRDMVRLLTDGHYIGLLMDQDPGYAGIMVKLFGKDTLTPDGPAKLAGIQNYPIMTIFIHEDRPYHHIIDIQPPLRPYASDVKLSKEERKRVMYDLTQTLNDRLEERIRQYPEDWFWLHNRWKWTRRYKEKEAAKNAQKS